jgi:hypothetical protein
MWRATGSSRPQSWVTNEARAGDRLGAGGLPARDDVQNVIRGKLRARLFGGCPGHANVREGVGSQLADGPAPP